MNMDYRTKYHSNMLHFNRHGGKTGFCRGSCMIFNDTRTVLWTCLAGFHIIFIKEYIYFWWYFWLNPRAFWPSIDCNATTCSRPRKVCSFITLWFKHWCHMDYFNVLTTFLGLECGIFIAVFHQKKYLICVSKMNEGLFGTTWGWVINDRIFIFGWTFKVDS